MLLSLHYLANDWQEGPDDLKQMPPTNYLVYYFSLQKLVARFFINWLVQDNSWVIEKKGVAQIHMGCAQVVK